MSEERRVTKIDYSGSRIETGSLQIGDDWPGVFIRGDAAAYYGMMIESFLENREDALAEIQVRGLARILSNCAADTYAQSQEREVRFAKLVQNEFNNLNVAKALFKKIVDKDTLESTLTDISIPIHIRSKVIGFVIDEESGYLHDYHVHSIIAEIAMKEPSSAPIDWMNILYALSIYDGHPHHSEFDRVFHHVDESTRQWYLRAHKS